MRYILRYEINKITNNNIHLTDDNKIKILKTNLVLKKNISELGVNKGFLS